MTTEELDHLINEYGGKHNIVFTVNEDFDEFKKDNILLMVDRSEHQSYSPNYKIYLTSTNLRSNSFYTMDFCSLINSSIFTPRYKFDLIKY